MQVPDHQPPFIPRESVEDWHAFVENYSALIFSVINRYLLRESSDERRTMYVNILQILYEGKLAEYDGRAALSTWITVVTRSRCLDFLRHKYGRRQPPRWLRSCSDQEKEIYRLYYLEGRSFREICAVLGGKNEPLSLEILAESIRLIEMRLDRGIRRRLAYDLEARSIGATSGALLEFLDELKGRLANSRDDLNPEQDFIRREGEAGWNRLSELLHELPAVEREVLGLRFEAGYSARKIAAELQLKNQRQVYTIIERGLKRLRGMFKKRSDLTGDHQSDSTTDARSRKGVSRR
jgi:DNA-directed RNA polymerase specialized sigma24 family protein